MGAKTKASISSDVAGNGEIPTSTDGLVAQWNFNETNGDIARSEGSCGKQCDGQLVNFAYTGSQDSAIGTGWTAKNKLWSIGSLMFDGVNDWVSIPNNQYLTLSNNWTMAVWLKPSKLNASYNTIYSWVTTVADTYYQFFLDGSGQVMISTNKEREQTWTGFPLPIDQWSHVVISVSGNTATAYINGISLGNKNATFPLGTAGARIGWDGIKGREYSGIMDAFTIYSRALPASEILANFKAQNGPTPVRQSLTATPVPSGTPNASGLLFKVRMPDVAQSVGTVKDVRVLITDKPGTLYDFKIDLQRVQGTDFFIANPIELDIPDGSYMVSIKHAKTLSRTFTVRLSKGKTLDCSRKDADTSCESLGRPELAPLFSGDSDGLVDTKTNNGVRANSYNVIDSADLQRVVSGYEASSLPPEPNGDLNLDGKIDVLDLGILGKNFGKKGD